MQLQKVTLIFPDGSKTVYIDIANTEDANDSLYVLDEHQKDGCEGHLSYGRYQPNNER